MKAKVLDIDFKEPMTTVDVEYSGGKKKERRKVKVKFAELSRQKVEESVKKEARSVKKLQDVTDELTGMIGEEIDL